jgi:hypothetical protein
MELGGFDEEFLNLSTVNDSNLWPSSPPNSLARHPLPELDGEDCSDETSGDEHSHDEVAHWPLKDECSEGSFGDEEQVLVASDQYSWKIDHAKGDHKFKGASRCMCRTGSSN